VNGEAGPKAGPVAATLAYTRATGTYYLAARERIANLRLNDPTHETVAGCRRVNAAWHLTAERWQREGRLP
jgi:hypothetical protein